MIFALRDWFGYKLCIDVQQVRVSIHIYCRRPMSVNEGIVLYAWNNDFVNYWLTGATFIMTIPIPMMTFRFHHGRSVFLPENGISHENCFLETVKSKALMLVLTVRMKSTAINTSFHDVSFEFFSNISLFVFMKKSCSLQKNSTTLLFTTFILLLIRICICMYLPWIFIFTAFSTMITPPPLSDFLTILPELKTPFLPYRGYKLL